MNEDEIVTPCPMTMDEYQTEAQTYNVVDTTNRLMHSFAGLAEEIGELLGAVKRKYRGDYTHNPTEYDRKVHAELGDCFWYLADVATQHGFSLSDIAKANLEKLAKRKEEKVILGEGDER